jgi:hypothetical protein
LLSQTIHRAAAKNLQLGVLSLPYAWPCFRQLFIADVERF